MCSIFGITQPSQEYKNFLPHRGPDHFDSFSTKDIYFAHNRLSIIGLDERSNQPMRGRNGTVIVFNGEIYNYTDLKAKELSDYTFKSNSDTEVILALYEKYGIECVQYLRGMFAFAIWDEDEKRLFCARDRFGIKPFYYTKNQDQFAFASEMKALLPLVPSIETHTEALSEYLTFQYTLDSSLITALTCESNPNFYGSFHGKFTDHPGYDESAYAIDTTSALNKSLYTINITSQDFTDNISKIIYHLDTPVAGPGAFPQYMVSKLASEHVKVVLGGQGGDELFGGYARYVIAYFEQSIKAAIDGTHKNGHFVVTPESIIPNLTLLQEYKPLIKEFWKDGLFGLLDERYFRLINRSVDIQDEVDWELFDLRKVMEKFKGIFNNQENVQKEAYFDKMTHFDFKCLLPALLHVEDRMSMAHGLESRVPFLDHPLVEFAATIPADIKFPGGRMKSLLKEVFKHKIPEKVLNRRDKMGFPVPLKEWFSGDLKNFLHDIFSSQQAQTRGFYDAKKVLRSLEGSSQFSRKIWGLLCLELWHREFHDKSHEYRY